jgi:hypothetical protein
MKALQPVTLPLRPRLARVKTVWRLLCHSLRHMHCTEVIWDNTHVVYACWNCNGKRSMYEDFVVEKAKE